LPGKSGKRALRANDKLRKQKRKEKKRFIHQTASLSGHIVNYSGLKAALGNFALPGPRKPLKVSEVTSAAMNRPSALTLRRRHSSSA
jgi:hypothetical protein